MGRIKDFWKGPVIDNNMMYSILQKSMYACIIFQLKYVEILKTRLIYSRGNAALNIK